MQKQNPREGHQQLTSPCATAVEKTDNQRKLKTTHTSCNQFNHVIIHNLFNQPSANSENVRSLAEVISTPPRSKRKITCLANEHRDDHVYSEKESTSLEKRLNSGSRITLPALNLHHKGFMESHGSYYQSRPHKDTEDISKRCTLGGKVHQLCDTTDFEQHLPILTAPVVTVTPPESPQRTRKRSNTLPSNAIKPNKPDKLYLTVPDLDEIKDYGTAPHTEPGPLRQRARTNPDSILRERQRRKAAINRPGTPPPNSPRKFNFNSDPKKLPVVSEIHDVEALSLSETAHKSYSMNYNATYNNVPLRTIEALGIEERSNKNYTVSTAKTYRHRDEYRFGGTGSPKTKHKSNNTHIQRSDNVTTSKKSPPGSPLLPPLYKQTAQKLTKRDFKQAVAQRPVSIDDVRDLRYLRIDNYSDSDID